MSGKEENPFAKHGAWFATKQAALESLLGKMHELPGSSVLPWDKKSGEGLVDLYYFTEGIPGTGITTMQLLGEGADSGYELLAFTRRDYIKNDNPHIPFNLIERHICRVFTVLANMSQEVRFESGETCEIPGAWNRNPSYLLLTDYLFDGQGLKIDDKEYRLLLVIEVFREELEFALKHGTGMLFEKLRTAGHYPYSDLDRPVLELS